MSDDQSTSWTRETPISDAVLDRAAEKSGVEADDLADALVELNASLIGRHPELEREHDYVTVDTTRAYRVPGAVWNDLADDLDFEDALADAVALAHTEQAQLLFADAVGVDDRFAEDEYGVVVGIETAEEF